MPLFPEDTKLINPSTGFRKQDGFVNYLFASENNADSELPSKGKLHKQAEISQEPEQFYWQRKNGAWKNEKNILTMSG